MFIRLPHAFAWPAAGLLLAVAVAVVAMALLVTNPGMALAQSSDACDLDDAVTGGSETTPGASIDFTFRFTDGCAAPVDEIVIVLHEDITVPSDFDEDDVVIFAGGRYTPLFADPGESGDDTEIVLPQCVSWRQQGSDDVSPDCTSVSLNAIRLEGLVLPDTPPEDDEPYYVTIEWGDGNPLVSKVGVNATLELDGDNEVGYGETIEIEGLGFSADLSVFLYAKPSSSSEDCSAASGSGWTEIGSTTVDPDHRFAVDVEITSNRFRSSGRYQICAIDGDGIPSNKSLPIEVTGGVEVVGRDEVSPGAEVTLRFIGGGSTNVTAVRVAGRQANYSLAGNNIIVTLPTNVSGTVVISVYIGSNDPISAKVTIGDADLTVSGVSSRGVGLGGQFLVRSNDLPGDEVCQVTLGGIPLAFLDDGNDRVRSSGDCPEIQRGGRFLGTVAVLNDDGSIRSDLINKLLDSDGEEELEITSDAGVKASADIEVAAPTLTVVPDEGEVTPGDYLVFRGENFPPDRQYYNPPNVTLEINGRIERSIFTSDGQWTYEYRVTSRTEGGERIRPVIKIDDYPLHELTLDLDIEVAAGKLEINPDDVRIGQPVRVTVSGLDRFVQGYSVRISNGPTLSFDGETRFASDGTGTFVNTTVIPEDYHRDYAEERTHPATFHVYKSGQRLPGVVATVTLLPQRYVPPARAPGIPNAPVVTADGPFGLIATWAKPADDGGSPITDYDVEYRVGNSGGFTDAVYDGAGTSHTMTGLSQSAEYQVRVRAINRAGVGGWSYPATGSTEPLIASIKVEPGMESLIAGEPARFLITLSHVATVTVRLVHDSAGGFGTQGIGECVITAGNECVYSAATSESRDSDSGSLTVEIAPAPEYAVGTPSAQVIIQNPAPTPTPVPPTPTPTPEPTATPEPTDTPVPPPPTIDQGALTSTIVAAVTTGETETRDRPVAEEDPGDGGLGGLAIALIVVAVVVALAVIGAVVTFVMRRRGGGGGAAGGGDDPDPGQ